MNIEELKQKALKCYGWSNAGSAWLHESGDGSAVVGNIDYSHDPAIRNPVAVVDVTQYDGFQDDSIELAQFYAAANPATILELIRQRDELLAALKACRKELSAWMRHHGEDIATQEAVAQARAAIAKAEG
jgi:hypothetical protein